VALKDRDFDKVILQYLVSGSVKVVDVTQYSKLDAKAGTLTIQISKDLKLSPGSYSVRVTTRNIKRD
jgi:hypothetical protein